jgi:ATP-dependent RNA helicase DeaD
LTKTADQPKRFDDFDITPEMSAALRDAGYTEPTPVQAGVIPVALEGTDVIGQARTGTGKTASFVIPILEQLDPPKRNMGPQALILVPTRELAVQVRDEVVKLAKGQKVQCVACYGGKPIRGQIEKLKRNPQLVVGTPGRVIDHIGRGTLVLNDVWCVVLDEADRMLDIGFRPDIEKILRRCPMERQTLLLSATVPPPIERLAKRYMHEPVTLNFSSKDMMVDTIDQFYFTVDNRMKFDLLVHLLNREQAKQAIIFCRTKRGVDRLVTRLKKKLDSVDCIHGDLPQGSRDRVMKSFRDARLRYLVATDVVGRGIDVSGISHIINFDTPSFCDDYVHRVGRTGRMGREGVAYTFVAPEEGPELTRIEQRINLQLKRGELQGFNHSAPVAAGPEKPANPPPASLMKRPPKKYRRGL